MKREPCPFCGDIAQEIFDQVVEAAREADERARLACQRSKYSVQDYWMCIEMRMSALADRIARKHYLSMRCPKFSFRMALNEFRKNQIKMLTYNGEMGKPCDPIRLSPSG